MNHHAHRPIELFDQGAGLTVVVVPPLPGRWPWIESGVRALAGRCRTITYSLCGESGSSRPAPQFFDELTAQLDAVFKQADVRRAVICGVSLGGLIALRFAATWPERVAGLVLASTPGPGFALDVRQQQLVRHPAALLPLFAATLRGRLGPEVRASFPDRAERWRFAAAQLRRLMSAPPSPGRMASRVRLALGQNQSRDCARISCPTLVLTGDPELDRIVPVASSCEYLSVITGARLAQIPATGHLGVVTRPAAWAQLVADFAGESARGREVA